MNLKRLIPEGLLDRIDLDLMTLGSRPVISGSIFVFQGGESIGPLGGSDHTCFHARNRTRAVNCAACVVM